MAIPVIMDCDPGHDDAIALILAYANPKIEIKAVITTAGNQTLDKTTLNARKILSFIGADVPVARGAPKPLFRELITAAAVHGESGLDGPVLPEPTVPELDMSGIELAYKTIMESPVPITIVPTGALTNTASLLLTYPEVKKNIARISLMGGASIYGNWTPAAEFNILVDPEAAHIVFNSGLPVTMCGLDVTHKALIRKSDTERIRSIGGPVSTMVAELLDFFAKFHSANFDFDGSPMHDPCAVAWLIDPSIFVSQKAHVDVECSGQYTTGATITTFDGFRGQKIENLNVDVVLNLDRQRFVDLIYNSLCTLDGIHPNSKRLIV